MASRDLFGRLGRASGTPQGSDSEPRADAPLGGTKSEALQRLQVGLTGMCAMILVIGLAGLIGGQADIAEEAAVPDAAPTTEPTAQTPQRDPLADAGVVPDIPVEFEPEVQPTEAAGDPVVTDGEVTVPDTPPTEPETGGRAP